MSLVKSQTLNVLVGKFSKDDSLCEGFNHLVVVDSIKETLCCQIWFHQNRIQPRHSTPSIKQKKGVRDNSYSDASFMIGKPSKSGKKNRSNRAKPKKRDCSKKLNSPESSLKWSGDYSQRGSFHFMQKAKHTDLLKIIIFLHQVWVETYKLGTNWKNNHSIYLIE